MEGKKNKNSSMHYCLKPSRGHQFGRREPLSGSDKLIYSLDTLLKIEDTQEAFHRENLAMQNDLYAITILIL
jgi:hypothetical protein